MPTAPNIVSQPINGYIDVVDRGGDVARLNVKTNSVVMATAYDLIEQMALDLATITRGYIVRYGITSEAADSTFQVSSVPTGVSIEEKAQVQARLTTAAVPLPGQTKWGKINIPAPIDAIFAAASGELYNIVDPANADLLAFLNNYTAGLGVLPSATLSDYQVILDPTAAGNIKGKRVPDVKRSF